METAKAVIGWSDFETSAAGKWARFWRDDADCTL